MKTVERGQKDLAEQDFPHTSSDEDVDNGVNNRFLDGDSEEQARRDDLVRRLESLLTDASEWLELSQTDSAEQVYSLLEDAYELLGEPLEDTDEELDTDTIELNRTEHTSEDKTEEEIDQELRQSFPASDPPANY